MRQKQYKKSEQSKKAILDAARRLAEENGFEKTSIKDIARESGLSVGAFYHHFESKDAVLNESFLQFDDQLTPEAFARYDAMPPLEAVKAVLVDQTLFTEKLGVRIMSEYYRALLQGKNRGAVNPQRKYYQTVQNYIEKAQNIKAITARYDSAKIAERLIRSVRGTLLDWCLRDGQYVASQQVQAELDDYLMPFVV